MAEFVTWMLLYPALTSLCASLRIKVLGGDTIGINARAWAAIVQISIWAYVGYLIYPK